MPHASGLAYSPAGGFFLALAGDSAEQPGGGPVNLTMISPFEELVGSASLPVIPKPINLAFDSKANRLILFDTAAQELIAIQVGPDGYLNPADRDHFEAGRFGVQDPLGMAIDPLSGALFILEGAEAQILRIEPDDQGGFEGAATLAGGRVSRIDLSELGLGALQGLAFHPTDGHLYLLNPAQGRLYEVSQAGQLLATRSFSGLDLEFRDPQGIVFAPSADLTDDPAQMHLFLMDSGLAPLAPPPSEINWFYLPFLVMPARERSSSAIQSPSPGPAAGGREELGPGRIIEFTLTGPAVVAPGQQDVIPKRHSIPRK
jgi:hypothetical protein